VKVMPSRGNHGSTSRHGTGRGGAASLFDAGSRARAMGCGLHATRGRLFTAAFWPVLRVGALPAQAPCRAGAREHPSAGLAARR
jgi:hypothetical protein